MKVRWERGREGERERGRGRGRWGDGEMRRWGDGEMGRWGDGEMGRWGDGEMGRWGDGEMGRWGDGEMGRWGDGEMGRWGDGRGGDEGERDTEHILHGQHIDKSCFTQVFEPREDVFVGSGQEQLGVISGDGLVDLTGVDVHYHCQEGFVGHFYTNQKNDK